MRDWQFAAAGNAMTEADMLAIVDQTPADPLAPASAAALIALALAVILLIFWRATWDEG